MFFDVFFVCSSFYGLGILRSVSEAASIYQDGKQFLDLHLQLTRKSIRTGLLLWQCLQFRVKNPWGSVIILIYYITWYTVVLIALYPTLNITFHQRIPKKMFSSYVPWPNSSDGAGRMGIQEWFMRPKYHATCFARNVQASLINLKLHLSNLVKLNDFHSLRLAGNPARTKSVDWFYLFLL